MTLPSPCPEPTPLRPDPLVAVVAYRYPSETHAGVFHDAALVRGEPCDCPGNPNRVWVTGERLLCGRCHAILRWWQCDCGDSTFRDRVCKHILDAKRRYFSGERINRRAP